MSCGLQSQYKYLLKELTPLVMVKKRQSPLKQATSGTLSDEVIAFCPVCKALQTVWFAEGRLVTTRKFSQDGDQVYHDCGSKEPCRLYRTY
jgi:hypothetical protein